MPGETETIRCSTFPFTFYLAGTALTVLDLGIEWMGLALIGPLRYADAVKIVCRRFFFFVGLGVVCLRAQLLSPAGRTRW